MDEVADQVDRAEFRIGHLQARRVRQEVEHGALLDRPTDGGSDRLQKLIELPLMGAKGRDVADGTHRSNDLDGQSRSVSRVIRSADRFA